MPVKLRCLIVDDHEDSARMLAYLLTMDGHAARAARSVEEAMQVGGEGSLDVLLTDLRLPDGSGWELLARLRKAHPTLVGIAVSGLVAAKDVDHSRAAGFALHLAKPLDLEQLRDALTRITRQITGHAAPTGPSMRQTRGSSGQSSNSL